MVPHPPRRLLVVGKLILVAVGCLPMTGCGDSMNSVSGSATFAGKPIPVGRIYFSPDSTKGNAGPTGFAEIKDGKYTTNGPGGRGVSGGPMIARIEGSDGIKIDEERPAGKPLFPSYEVAVELPKSSTTKDFDVPASATKAKPGGGGAVVP